MGFFSWECNACHHPMLSHWATNGVNDWMQQVTVFLKDGSAYEGTYNGYGKIVDLKREFNCGEEAIEERKNREEEGKQLYSELEPMCHHTACWLALTPKQRSETKHKTSKYAVDQGYFFGDEHNMGEPK